jgi:hypothetical protein
MNPKYWDDADAGDVQDAYGEDWERVAAFEYDGVAYTMVKILEPVLVLAKEDPVRVLGCFLGVVGAGVLGGVVCGLVGSLIG